MKRLKLSSLAIFTVVAAASGVIAQETQTRVVDEVIAVVNNDVITLSSVKREIKSAVDSFVAQGKTREEAQRMVDEKQGELIANMINEELVLQKAKDLGIEKDVDEKVNQRMLDLMKQYNLKTVDELYALMEKSGADPKEVKENWRREETRDQIFQREIQSKVYWEPTGKDLKEYYEKHREKFTKPETVSFSELFLGFAGRSEAAVRDKSVELYRVLKAGANFDQVVKDNGDRGVVTQGAGKAEHVLVKDLGAKLLPLRDLKVGDYTSPFELEQMGIVILRLDARDHASDESQFNENAVRMAILTERLPEAQKKYFAELRDDSYIKVSDVYRPLVMPVLNAEAPTPAPAKEKGKGSN